MVADVPTLTSPSPVADPLAGLLVAIDLRGVQLLLDANGQPRAKLPPGAVLDAETRALLVANREAIVDYLRSDTAERRSRLTAAFAATLWPLGKQVQALAAERGWEDAEVAAMKQGWLLGLRRLEEFYGEARDAG